MSYINDPRELAIRPESGVTLEQDNRVETMYHWGAMVLDLCDMPVSEYMKPMTVIGIGGSGGGSVDTGDTPTTVVTEEVKIYLSIYKNEILVSDGESVVLGVGEDLTENVWKAQWEWTGTIPNVIRVAATIKTDKGEYLVSKDLTENPEKKATAYITEAQGDYLVQFKNFGVGSSETPEEEIVNSAYTETIKEEDTEYKYKYEISTEEKIIFLTLKLILDGALKYSAFDMKYQQEIPFSDVNTEKEGYDFIGWFDEKGNEFKGTTMPAYNLTLKGKYEPKTYNVDFVFVIDGEVGEPVSSIKVKHNSTVPSSAFPKIDTKMYKLHKWEPSQNTKITSDTVFSAILSTIVYTVTWSGYTDGVLTQEYNYGDELIEPIIPEKEGHTFSGWTPTPKSPVVANAKYTAILKPNYYKVNYYIMIDGEMGEPVSSTTVLYGNTIPYKSVPSEKGYTFSEWQGYTQGMKMPAKDLDFISEKTTNSYSILYFVDGEFWTEKLYKYQEAIEPLEYIKEGYNVSEWKPTLPEKMPYYNLSAYCTTEVMRYNVIFVDENGNTVSEAKGVPYNTPIIDIIPLVEEGYSYTITSVDVNETVKDNMTIIGKLSINEYKVTIICGETQTFVFLPYGTNIQEYIDENYQPEEGYKLNATFTHTFVPANDTAEVTIEYIPKEYVLTYSTTGSDSNLNGSIIVTFGSKILDKLPSTEKEGYEFNGWFIDGNKITEEFTMPSKDIDVNGTYNVLTYDVRVFDGAETILEYSYVYKTKLSSVLNDDKLVEYVDTQSANGYTVVFTLDGEEVNEDMEITSNLDIYVEKVPNEYTLIFMNGEDVISAKQMTFGEIIIYPTMENKFENNIEYVFVWNDTSYSGKPMPATNLVIYGGYQEKSVGEIYYGSFFIGKEDASKENLVQYFNEEDLYNGIYGSVKVKDCIDVYKQFTLIVPPYDEFVNVPDYIVDELRNNYYASLTLIIPVDTVKKYNVSIKDDLAEYWSDYITDNEIINVNGVDCYFFVRYSDFVTPYLTEQYLEFKLKLSEKKQYNLTFKNGEEEILTVSKYEGDIIEYPIVENKEENGEVYVFIWEDESYNGQPMPSYDVEIKGSYQMKGKAPIYYGSFVIEQSEASTENLNQYFDETQLKTDVYGSINVDSCIDKEYIFEYVVPAYEPFKDMPDFLVDEMRNNFYAPLTLIIPKDVYETYTLSIVDEMGVNYWGDYNIDDEVIKINGDSYVFCVRYSTNVTPYLSEQHLGFKLKLTKK